MAAPADKPTPKPDADVLVGDDHKGKQTPGTGPRDHLGGFVALRRSPETFALLANDPKAFLLLSLVGLRCRWNADALNLCGLEVGEALVGDHEACGFTRKEYRLALARLVRYGIIGATTRASKGTVVTLLKCSIYNPHLATQGPEEGPIRGHHRGQQGATKKNCNKAKTEALLPSLLEKGDTGDGIPQATAGAACGAIPVPSGKTEKIGSNAVDDDDPTNDWGDS